MPKRFLFISIILVIPTLVLSQSNLEVKGTGNNLFLEHSVVSKENFYSIGRLFNIAPRDLAAYNHLSMDKGLSVGQQLKVPLTKDNFTQNLSKSAFEALVPVYHTVSSGETLYRLGVNYKNVPLDNIKKWNNLSGDNVNQGASLIIGFLRVSKSESALAKYDFGKGGNKAIASVEKPSEVQKPSVQEPEKKPEIKQEAKPAQDNTNTAVGRENSSVPNTPTPILQNETANTATGFFKAEFEKENAGSTQYQVSGAAAVFKSTSGWQDKKYYCFNNEAIPGSIIRITSQGNSKAIYAKVLDAIPDIKQNEGLTLVLSNAGAEALGISGDKFDAIVQYYK